ncbi:MAG: general secretion pathway protein GspB [Woeseiaceae bacterium]
MSFILDALKKSESDRQQHGPAEFASVPTSNGRQGAPRWLWVLGVLLAVNLVVLIGLLLRPDVAVTPAASVQVATDNDSFAEQVAQARQNIPAREEPRTDASRPAATGSTSAPVTTMPAASAPPASSARRRAANTASLPTIHEVLANGTVTLPALHVDIHVFADSPEDRFVFINMNKQVEGSRLAEGPIVEEITTDGVVLNYNGTSFVLPRD